MIVLEVHEITPIVEVGETHVVEIVHQEAVVEITAPGVQGAQGPPGTVDLSTAKGVIAHGANAATARPVGYASVEWVGSVPPANAIDGDTWVNTA